MPKEHKKTQKWKITSEFNPSLSLVEQILLSREILDVSEFLNPKSPIEIVKSYFPQDFFQSIAKTKEIVFDAIEKKKPIVIFGDYDADGICATSILYSFLKIELGYDKVTYFIPNRFDHGYGLSKGAVDKCLHGLHEPAVIISVDTGITAVKESEYIKELGHTLIITDHHQKPETLPTADALVWSDKIVGSTISWLVTKFLGSKNQQSISLAALATVTDLQPLLGFNRSLVTQGLRVMNTNPYQGISLLMEKAGKKDSEITVYDFGFVIGPRLNASGRLLDAGEAVNLFVSKDKTELEKVAGKLSETNNKRQDITLEMFELASISSEVLPKIIVSSSAEFHEGIIGLVAARLVQKYYRPSIVIALAEEFGKGSARSIPGINIIELLRNYSDMFTNLGGHPMAAGFTIDKSRIDEFIKLINEKAATDYSEHVFEPYIEIDLEIPTDLLTLGTVQELEKLKPFGVGNKEPVFLSRDLKVSDLRLVGKDNSHLSAKLSDGATIYKAIMFGAGELFKELGLGDHVDIVYNAKINEFNGTRSVNLTLIDIKKNEN